MFINVDYQRQWVSGSLALRSCIWVSVTNKVDKQNNSTEIGLLLALYLKYVKSASENIVLVYFVFHFYFADIFRVKNPASGSYILCHRDKARDLPVSSVFATLSLQGQKNLKQTLHVDSTDPSIDFKNHFWRHISHYRTVYMQNQTSHSLQSDLVYIVLTRSTSHAEMRWWLHSITSVMLSLLYRQLYRQVYVRDTPMQPKEYPIREDFFMWYQSCCLSYSRRW